MYIICIIAYIVCIYEYTSGSYQNFVYVSSYLHKILFPLEEEGDYFTYDNDKYQKFITLLYHYNLSTNYLLW